MKISCCLHTPLIKCQLRDYRYLDLKLNIVHFRRTDILSVEMILLKPIHFPFEKGTTLRAKKFALLCSFEVEPFLLEKRDKILLFEWIPFPKRFDVQEVTKVFFLVNDDGKIYPKQ